MSQSNTASQTLTDYQNITDQLKNDGITWPKNMQEEALSIDSTRINISELTAKVADFAPTQGWVQTLDTLQEITPDNAAQVIQDNTIIVSAECLNAKGQTLSIRPQGNQRIVTLFTPNEGEAYLTSEVTQLMDINKYPKEATYKLYWRPSDTTQPAFSRLIRITDTNQKGAK